MSDQRVTNVVGVAVRPPPRGSKPRAPAGVQKTCRQCKAPTRFVKGFVICEQDPSHNFKPIKVECGMCGAGKSELVVYPGKVWCTKCAATTVSTNKEVKAVKKVAPNASPKVVAPRKTKKEFPKLEKKPRMLNEIKQEVHLPTKNQLKWFGVNPKSKQSKGKKFPWAKVSVGKVNGLESRIFTTSNPFGTIEEAQVAALKESPCFECGGRFAIAGGWSEYAPPSGSGKMLKGSICTMACPRNNCLVDYNVVVVVDKMMKKVRKDPLPSGEKEKKVQKRTKVAKKVREFKTEPLPLGKKNILTPQPILDPKTRPTDVSEDQVKIIFEEESKKHNLREKIVAAFVEANKNFRLADSGARQNLINNARRQIKALEREMPQRLNLRRKTGAVRSVPLRWKINRRTILNPLWSVTLSLLSESDSLNQEDLELIQETAYHCVILESLLPMKKKRRRGQSKKVTAVTQPPTPFPSEELSAEDKWNPDMDPDPSWLNDPNLLVETSPPWLNDPNLANAISETQEERFENQ